MPTLLRRSHQRLWCGSDVGGARRQQREARPAARRVVALLGAHLRRQRGRAGPGSHVATAWLGRCVFFYEVFFLTLLLSHYKSLAQSPEPVTLLPSP